MGNIVSYLSYANITIFIIYLSEKKGNEVAHSNTVDELKQKKEKEKKNCVGGYEVIGLFLFVMKKDF